MLFAADIGNSCIDIGLFDEVGNLKMKSKIYFLILLTMFFLKVAKEEKYI